MELRCGRERGGSYCGGFCGVALVFDRQRGHRVAVVSAGNALLPGVRIGVVEPQGILRFPLYFILLCFRMHLVSLVATVPVGFLVSEETKVCASPDQQPHGPTKQ